MILLFFIVIVFAFAVLLIFFSLVSELIEFCRNKYPKFATRLNKIEEFLMKDAFK